MNNYFFDNGIYNIFLLQFIFYQFLHGGFFHLVFNSIFIYVFGNHLEILMGKTKFLYFFIFNTIFTGIMVLLFSKGNTIGISGFCLALLTYLTIELYNRGNPEYKGGITAIIINVAIGLTPGISLAGHLFGSIAGILYYFLNKIKRN
nr:rhomboid family intramembrane serine protease [Candidatus Gracilibacteria bacterium]